MSRNNVSNNELFTTAHIMILESYTIFSAILIGESLLLGWERWALILILAAMASSWIIHLRGALSERVRLWIYSCLMMATFFFYGIHGTSTYDLAPVMIAVIMIYTMAGVIPLIYLCIGTYFLTMLHNLIVMVINGETFDSLVVTRTLLHFSLLIMGGWISTTIIHKWNIVLKTSNEEIDALEETSRRMSDFMANVSHEIRTPINAVIGLSSVLEKEDLPEPVLDNVKAISVAGHRVVEQIGDILDFSEIDMGALSTNEENYMITSVVNDLMMQLAITDDYDLDLVVDMEAGIPSELKGDESKIKKILWHLITNGYKFTKEGGVFLHIYSVKRSYGVNLIIEVRDTGIGMSEKEIEHSFEKFYQANSGRSRTEGGLGLGIPIVSGFVNSMDGVLSISSVPGRGTIVRVSIPQEIVTSEPCLSVKDSENCITAGYLSFMTTGNLRIREFYMEMITHLVSGLSIPFHRVESRRELEKLIQSRKVTHVFVGTGEYLENREYIEDLSHKLNVALVADRGYVPDCGKLITVLPKPFYGVQVAKFLNHSIEREHGEEKKRMTCPGLKALVVDDEPMNLLVARGILETYEMSVVTASGGQEALSICANEDFDLIFMDHMMPGMDGVEVMKRLRLSALKEHKELCIIALTANATSSAREMFLSEGFDAFVPKPIEIIDLERVLRRVLPKSAIEYVDSVSYGNRAHEESQTAGEKDVEITLGNDEKDIMNKLEDLKIDTSTGLRYCQGDSAFYKQVLTSYIENSTNKADELDALYKAENWIGYSIQIHAVKSSSKMIGSNSLFETARLLEEASKLGDSKTLKILHPDFLTEYNKTTDGIASILKEYSSSVPAEAPGEITEEGILEFIPEGSGQ